MTQTQARSAGSDPLASMIEALGGYRGAANQFASFFVRQVCQSAPAAAGALFAVDAAGQVGVQGIYPPVEKGAEAPVWLREVASAAGAINELSPIVAPLPESAATGLSAASPLGLHVVLVPIALTPAVKEIAAFVVAAEDRIGLAQSRDRLEVFARLRNLFETSRQANERQADLDRFHRAVRVLATLQEQSRFMAAAMALCNQVAADFGGDRVALGMLHGRYVKLKSLNHTEKITRQMRLAQEIESAMEECVDQDVEILHPAPTSATYVSKAAAELSAHHGPTAVCVLPLRHEGKVIGAISVERPTDKPMPTADIEALRLAADLCSPWLHGMFQRDRWFGARWALASKRGLANLVGPEHTWAKALAIAVLAFLVFVIVAKGNYRVEAPFTLDATVRQVVPAPFNGYLEKVNVKPGDKVEANTTVLATLDASELRLKLASAKADEASYLKQADQAMRDSKTVEVQIAQAQAERTRAQMRLLEYQIEQSTLRSPVTGVVVQGDLQKQLGAPVQTGQAMFEVAPLDALYAEVSVPEDRIPEIHRGDRGELASASHPGEFVGFTVERINPVAEVVKDRNVFKMRVKLERIEPWMRPGMEGLARVDLGKARYAWIWTRPMINWIRMKLWM